MPVRVDTEVAGDVVAGFLRDALAFLEAHAFRRRTTEGGGWGVGSDDIGLLDLHPEGAEEEAVLERSRAWRRLVFDSGFGWSSGPVHLGGGGRPANFDEEYRVLEQGFDVPDQQPFATGTHLVAPAVLAHGSDDLQRRYLPGIFRGDLVVLPAAQRAGGRLRPGRPAHPRGPRRRRLDRHGPEGLVVPGAPRADRSGARPHRTPTCPSTRASPCSSWRWTAPG